MGVYEEVKQALQDIVAPELRSIQVEIRRLDDKIDSIRNEIGTEIRRLDEKIDIAIQIRERLATLEAKVATILFYCICPIVGANRQKNNRVIREILVVTHSTPRDVDTIQCRLLPSAGKSLACLHTKACLEKGKICFSPAGKVSTVLLVQHVG
ncbi:MAG: hypothetical protein JRJ79_14140 [Deltaproteobacteria bacterium]|nr:hypothetical protein [Deltaproteobacteria bacterium]MBW1795344.1 hypothetical protein [Deltaproteobacteria bacterium]